LARACASYTTGEFNDTVTLDAMNPESRLFVLLALGCLSFGVSAASGGQGRESQASTCLSAATWNRLDGAKPRSDNANSVLTGMAQRDVVLLGEQHDEVDDHRWQLQTIAALHAQRPDMVLGFEMFPRRVQTVLDRWVAGDLTVRQFLEQSEWDKVWALPAEFYLPLFEFARINRIPMLALDIDQKVSRTIAEKGWDAVATAERDGVSRAVAPPAAYRDFLRNIYRDHPRPDHAKAEPDKASVDRGFDYFVEAQTTRERSMAEALTHRAAVAADGRKPLMVGIMGNGHVRFGWGVPHQLRDLGVQKIGILMPLPADTECGNVRAGLADAVFALPKQVEPPVEPPRLGIRLGGEEGKVNIAEVTANSLAEKTGLKSGDRLLEIAGQPVKKIAQVIAVVRQQPAGTWLPLQVRRGDETLDLVVRFPARP
jgi:uncharacterized iron-regulated protein